MQAAYRRKEVVGPSSAGPGLTSVASPGRRPPTRDRGSNIGSVGTSRRPSPLDGTVVGLIGARPIAAPRSIDLDWQPEPLFDAWPGGWDTKFILERMEEAFLEQASAGAPGRLLDVACGRARHGTDLHRRGWKVFGLDPSLEMIARPSRRRGSRRRAPPGPRHR